jgi:hypothetical protein
VRQQIPAERNGVPLPDSAPEIRRMREERDAQIAKAAFGE